MSVGRPVERGERVASASREGREIAIAFSRSCSRVVSCRSRSRSRVGIGIRYFNSRNRINSLSLQNPNSKIEFSRGPFRSRSKELDSACNSNSNSKPSGKFSLTPTPLQSNSQVLSTWFETLEIERSFVAAKAEKHAYRIPSEPSREGYKATTLTWSVLKAGAVLR